MPDPTRPPFWTYAAKALAALATGVVVAGGTILAAVADDHVTTTEWVTIVLAVLGAVVGPTAVYATRNAAPANRLLSPAGTDRLAAVQAARRHPSPRLPPEDRQ